MVAIIVHGEAVSSASLPAIDLLNSPAETACALQRSRPQSPLRTATRPGFASTRASFTPGSDPDPSTGAIMTPIYATSTYVQIEPRVHKGYDYARTGNPTRDALEACTRQPRKRRARICFRLGAGRYGNPGRRRWTPARTSSPATTCTAGTYRLFENVRKRSANLQRQLRRHGRSAEAARGDRRRYAG